MCQRFLREQHKTHSPVVIQKVLSFPSIMFSGGYLSSTQDENMTVVPLLANPKSAMECAKPDKSRQRHGDIRSRILDGARHNLNHGTSTLKTGMLPSSSIVS
mmetsp:Transcript_920/g.2885  ORF Transcript_920/g.2885 Transcript_920/m.2885 type:complete len:102 (+) Transcript_920:1544-1849(+)